MRKILSVIKREYLQIVRTKGFIIGTVLGPVLMVSFIIIPVLVSVVSVDKQEKIGVVDLSGQVFSELEQKLDMKLKDGQKRFLLREYKSIAGMDRLREELNQSVLEKELTAYIFIPKGIAEGEPAEFFSEHVSDFDKIETIREGINSVVVEKRLELEGLDPEKIAEYMKRIPLKTSKVSKRGVEEDTGGTFFIAYFLILILYMTLIFYGTIIMRGVIEEKTSRVVEVVLSSLKPFQLMMGKILGIAAVGLTQYLIWALFGLAATKYSGVLVSGIFPAAEGFKIPTIPAYIFVYFVIFFILGYFLYGTLYAAVGSMVNSEKEAQQLTFPVTMSLVVPFLLVMFVIRAPNSTLSVVLSLIPFFSPILMMVRVGILLPPFSQIMVSIILLVITTLLMVWLAAKIYRVGILMYGKRPAVREIIKWLRYK
jgi:ABC-2 type transport system permease protein